MSPYRSPPEPLATAFALVNEAQRTASEDWRRVLLANARTILEHARASVADGEEALREITSPAAKYMRDYIDARRTQIDQLATRLDRIDNRTAPGSK